MQASGDLLWGVGDAEVRGYGNGHALGNVLNLELWFAGVYHALMVHNIHT